MLKLASNSGLPFAGPVRPLNEVERLSALASHQIMDTPAESIFDQVTQTAAQLCDAPTALLSLLDSSRQWFKSAVGTDIPEMPRDISLCSYAILQPKELLVIEDTLKDSRFSDHPMVRDGPKIRFYAGTPLCTPAGHALGTLCVVDTKPHSMTESQRQGLQQLGNVVESLLEQRLSEVISPLLNRVIEEKLGVGISIIDAGLNDRSITYCSPSFEKLFAYGKGELVGKTLNFLQGTNPDQASLTQLNQAFDSHTENTITLKSRRKDGSSFWNETTISPVFNAQGKISHYFSIHRDASRRHEAEERNSEFGVVLEESLNEIYICDAKTFKFIQVNKGARRNLGYSLEELAEMTPLDASDDATRERILNAPPEIQNGTGKKFVYQGVNKRKDGSTYDVEAHIQRMMFNGRPVYVAIVMDITARVKAEHQLREAQEQLEQRVAERTSDLESMTKIAERANEGKSRFLSAASHDLRQPLQALRLYLSALMVNLDQPKSVRLANKMQLSLDGISSLLDSLLDITALESGTVTPNKQDVLLAPILDRLNNVNKHQANAKGLKFECTELDCVINTDAGLLERIVENFITNAIRYTDQGTVTVRAKRLNSKVRISVSDTGIGILDVDLENIFEEYCQLEQPGSERKVGLGLGLSIAQHIANLLDLSIQATSVVGTGSTFSVDVPLGTELLDIPDTSQVLPSELRRVTDPTVLIVDDDPDVMDAMVELVSSFEIDLHTAMNGRDALELIERGLIPDLLVTDFRMPGMNGIELARALREKINIGLPVILMTGDTSASEIRNANLPNCSIFLKPISVDDLMPLIESTRPA